MKRISLVEIGLVHGFTVYVDIHSRGGTFSEELNQPQYTAELDYRHYHTAADSVEKAFREYDKTLKPKSKDKNCFTPWQWVNRRRNRT